MKSLHLILLLFFSLPLFSRPEPQDWCCRLSRDITNSDHGFIAGNQLYYIGGRMDVAWNMVEHQSLGFSHPFYRDGSSRGFSIAQSEFGSGHDMWGWEFWNRVKVADGSIFYNGHFYRRPAAKSVIWRPDRQEALFQLDDLTICESKFINDEDVLVAIIEADKDCNLKFEGQSFYLEGKLPTFDGDPAVPYMTNCHPDYWSDRQHHLVIEEHGDIMAKPQWDHPAVPGKMMYEGLNAVLTSSIPFSNIQIARQKEGYLKYNFMISLKAGHKLVLTYTVNRNRQFALDKSRRTWNNADEDMAAKTTWMNDLLNNQIPSFDCSDTSVVDTYYYLWALYFMYFIDNQSGFDNMPHTQTAVNNFMGLHVYDSWAYAALGSWVDDKPAWGYGNLLLWKNFVKYSQNGKMTDNFGATWWSPNQMTFVGMVNAASKMYHHSGDLNMLKEAYEMFLDLYTRSDELKSKIGLGEIALEKLLDMTDRLECHYDYPMWKKQLDENRAISKNVWDLDNNYIKKDNWDFMDICDLFVLYSSKIPKGFAQKISDEWLTDTEKGFLSLVPLDVRPVRAIENGVFAVSSISSWLAIDGMFHAGLDEEAVLSTIGHLKGMTKDYGYPVAPECWNPAYKPWCDLHYNWDGSFLLLLLERIAGIEYSIVDNSLSITERMPAEWDFMNVSIPVHTEKGTEWTEVCYTRQGEKKQVNLTGHEFKKVKINLWDEGRKVVSHNNAKNSASIVLGVREDPIKSFIKIYPEKDDRLFVDSVYVDMTKIGAPGVIRYAVNGEVLGPDSPLYTGPLLLRESSDISCSVFCEDPGEKGRILHGPVYNLHFKRADALPAVPVEPAAFSHGLVRRYYPSDVSLKGLPDFRNLHPAAEEVKHQVGLDAIPSRENFALSYEGYIDMAKSGVYKFTLVLNDGGRLYIDDQMMIDFDYYSAHSRDPWRKTASVPLEKGFHKIRIEYFQGIGRSRLELLVAMGKENPHYVNSKDFYHRRRE